MAGYRLVVNPAAGGGRGAAAIERLREVAAVHGVTVQQSGSAGELTSLCERAVADGVERVIVVGGDGTFHHAIQALAGTGTELGLVPAGSGNDLATSLGIPGELGEAAALALEGHAKPIDLGRVAGRRFAVYCGVGFDSEVARWVAARRRRGSKLVYVLGVLRTLIGFDPPSIEVEHDAGYFSGKAMFVTVANCPSFGGGMRIAPEARPDDGELDVVIVRRVSRLELLRVFPRVYRGAHVDHPAVSLHRARRVRIRLDRAMVLVADGEPLDAVTADGVEVTIGRHELQVVIGSS